MSAYTYNSMLHPVRGNCGYHPKLSIHNRIPHTSVGYLCHEALSVNSDIPYCTVRPPVVADGSQGYYLNSNGILAVRFTRDAALNTASPLHRLSDLLFPGVKPSCCCHSNYMLHEQPSAMTERVYILPISFIPTLLSSV